MSRTDCILDEQLVAYAANFIDTAEAKHVDAHLGTCARCRDRLAEFETDEAFARKLRAAADETATLGRDTSEVVQDAVPGDQEALPRMPGYEILGEVGRGGMGVVYKAIQTELGREVALKILPSFMATINPDAVDRFRREASAASKLHHHNIIPVYDFGQAHGTYYYAMELIEGRPLHKVIRQLAEGSAASASTSRLAALLGLGTARASHEKADPLTKASETMNTGSGSVPSSTARRQVYYHQVARWIADVADALHYAHNKGIIHRDIKPPNLILSTDGRLMVADFGLAKSTDAESVTVTGSLVGTWRYMSPEQALARRMRVDHRTDVYSLGATMYELLVFRPVFDGTDQQEIVSQIITKEPKPPRQIVSSVPRELETICLKTLEKSPDARYDSAKELSEDLRRYTEDLPIVAKRPGPIRRTHKFLKRHKAASIAASAFAVMLIAIGLWVRASANARRAEAARIAARVTSFEDEGLRLQGLGQWSDAAEKYNEALRLESAAVRALGNLAICKKEIFNSDPGSPISLLQEARQLCDKALTLNPHDAQFWNTKAVVLKKLDDYGGALNAYEHCVELEPASMPPWNNLGVLHVLVGNLGDARTCLLKATQLAIDPERHMSHPWRNLAALQLLEGNVADARQSVARAITFNRSDAEARLLRSRVLLALDSSGSRSEALFEAQEAVRSKLDFGGRAQRVLALAYLRNDQVEQAFESSTKAVEAGDMPAINHLILAIAEAKQGRSAQTRSHLDAAATAWPANLRSDGSHKAAAPAGVLWVESARELRALSDEARRLLKGL